MKKVMQLLVVMCCIVPSMQKKAYAMNDSDEEALPQRESQVALGSKKRLLSNEAGLSLQTVSTKKNKKAVFNKARLDDNALTRGFGYKASNLIELDDFCQNYSLQEDRALKVGIPPYFAISSSIMSELLQNAGFNINERWRGVVARQENAREDTFSDGFLVARDFFEKDLSTALDRLMLNSGEMYSEYASFIADSFKRHKKLMVRSTGKEDSATVANAGGNESIPNVEPTFDAVKHAIKKVVLSYFSSKSLTQRLVLKDPTVFSGEVFIPVLIQEMIGEQKEQQVSRGSKFWSFFGFNSVNQSLTKDQSGIPVSGVMFTKDPECGHLGGATIIQSAYGHGEGIVNSLVPVDTFYAMSLPNQEIAVYPVVRNKTERIAPATAGKLIRKKNKVENAVASSLDVEAARELYLFGRALEQFYGYPLDIEFVVKNRTIFIVQARPIVHKQSNESPAYLRQLPYGSTVIKGTTIGAAGGYLREITEPHEILCTQTLGDALNRYLDKSFNREALKVVVVGTMAAATSHEATMFRSVGIPVLMVDKWEEVEALLHGDKKIIIDVQQGQLVIVNKDQSFSQLIQAGWSSYPAPRELSINPDFFEATLPINGDGKTPRVAWSILLKAMKNLPHEKIQAIVTQFLFQFDSVLSQDLADSNIQSQQQSLRIVAKKLCKNIIACAQYDEAHPLYMQRLLPIRLLESLVYQQGENGIVQQHSIATLQYVVKQEVDLLGLANDIPEKARPLFVQLAKVASHICSHELQNLWLVFIKEVVKDRNVLQVFATFIGKLGELEILVTWVQTYCAYDLAQESLTAERVKNLVIQWMHDFSRDADYLKEVMEKVASLKRINYEAFADHVKSEASWLQLQQLVNYFIAEEFTIFRDRGVFARMAAVQAMRAFVDLYDLALKGVNAQKDVQLFKTMLQENFKLLQVWVNLLTDDQVVSFVGTAKNPSNHSSRAATKEAYFFLMEALVSKNYTEADFLPTPGVNVAMFAIGSWYDFKKDADLAKQPASGADLFSIMHQSLLNYCSIISSQGLEKLKRPELLCDAEALVKSIKNIRPIGFNGTSYGMALLYNIPLGCHSCQVKLEYTIKTKQVAVDLNFYGGVNDERYRWACGAFLVAVLEAMSPVNGLYAHLGMLSIHQLTVSFIYSTENCEMLKKVIDALIKLACTNPLKEHDLFLMTIDEESAMRIIPLLKRFGPIGFEAFWFSFWHINFFSDDKEIIFSDNMWQCLAEEFFKQCSSDIFLSYSYNQNLGAQLINFLKKTHDEGSLVALAEKMLQFNPESYLAGEFLLCFQPE